MSVPLVVVLLSLFRFSGECLYDLVVDYLRGLFVFIVCVLFVWIGSMVVLVDG